MGKLVTFHLTNEFVRNMIAENLTKSQKEAIGHYKGPALVVAGPGAGKTYVITERVKKLITENEVLPKNILVTTFTDKAADELKVKLARTIGKKAELIQISTIHSFCKNMLEKYFLHHEFGAEIDVLDDESQKLLLELSKFNLGLCKWVQGKPKYVKDTFGFMNQVRALYNTITENKINVEELIIELRSSNNLSEDEQKILEGYKQYLEILNLEKKIDFASLQTMFYDLIESNTDVLQDIQESFEFVLVDEYQDTSPIQDKIFRLISGSKKNLFVVGDEDQSIYGFRGASIRNFKNFIKRYPEAKSYLLNVNFRSTQTIVNFSNSVFEKEMKKVLEAKRREGEKIKVISGEDSDITAKKTVELIKELKEKGIINSYGDIALLFRSLRNHSPEFIKYLSKEKIPHVTFGDGKFLERYEIRTIIYLMSYVTQELYIENKFREWQDWWRKDIFLTDFFDFSDSSKKIITEGSFSLYDLRHDEDFEKVGFKTKKDITKLKKLNKLKYDVEKDKDSEGSDPGKNSLLKIFYKILDYSGYFEKLMNRKEAKDKENLHNLGKLSEIIGRYQEISKKEDVKGFLWYIYNSGDDIDQKLLEDENTVKLMTVHKAKGLEFPVVFMCCMNEGRFPLRYKGDSLIDIPKHFLDKKESEDDEEEHYLEEKRLFYVGLTRAQDNLIFTTSNKHRVNKWDKSRFLEIIPADCLTDDLFKLPAEKKYKVEKKIPSLNYSAINTFIDCPLRYTLVYDFAFMTPASFMQRMGTFIHNSLQRIHESIKKKKEISPAEMKKIVETYWIDLPISAKKNDEWKEKKTKQLVNYYIHSKEYFQDIIAIEESFSYIDNDMIIKGKVDLIAKDKDGKICLIDFKARTAEGIEKTNVDKQLQIYNHCLENKFEPERLVAYTFEDNKQTDFKPDKKGTHAFLENISKKISKEDFHKQKNPFCKECQFRFYCWGENEKLP